MFQFPREARQPLDMDTVSVMPRQQQFVTTNSLEQTMRHSPSNAKLERLVRNRQVAASFIYETTGSYVPCDSDTAFRHSLADGIILCQLLNAMKPGTISKIVEASPNNSNRLSTPTGETIRTFENVSNFIIAAKQFTTESFSASDLDEDNSDRPQVVDCILSLRDWYMGGIDDQCPSARLANWTTINADVGPSASAPSSPTHHYQLQTSTPIVSHTNTSHQFSFTPEAAELVAKNAAALSDAAVGNNQQGGINYLLQSCTHMLKSKMGLPATPLPPAPANSKTNPDVAMDAVGPILETVLANLTQEYERRLMIKDQEQKASNDTIAILRKQVEKLEGRAHEAALQAAAESDAVRQEERFELDRLRAEESSLRRELHSKQEELASVRARFSKSAEQAEAELQQLRAQVEEYSELYNRYRVIQEENRQLYNTVQDLRGNIRVYCRIRPSGATGDHSTNVVEPGEEGSLAVFSHRHGKWMEYNFDRIFGQNSTQDDIYDETKPLIRSVLDGYNVCIFAYGQTGSGKTHTMHGSHVDDSNGRGMYFRALDDLFTLNYERKEVEYKIKVQLLEVYNEAVRDLLGCGGGNSLQLLHTARSGSNVPDATQIEVECTEDVLEVMSIGARNRATAETKMNDRSSRSHQVLTIMVDGVNSLSGAKTHGCLHLIDLAGSERVAKSGAEGAQMIEAQHINRSLSALGNVMQALAQKREHVPYRDSKLTMLLQDSLAGQAKSLMFMHIAPEMNSASETLSTLNFGKAVTEITLGAAKANTESGSLIAAKERAIRMEREASTAKIALEEEKKRTKELQAELQALRQEMQVERAHRAATPPSGSRSSSPASVGDTIPAFRPVLNRPAQVGRLNLSGLTPVSSNAANSNSNSNESPASARASKIPTPGSFGNNSKNSGSLTSRPVAKKPSPLGYGGRPLTARDSTTTDRVGSGSMTARASLSTYTGSVRSSFGASSQQQQQRRWM